MGVDQAGAVIVTEMKAAAVPIGSTVHGPAGIAGIDLARRIGEDFLNVPIPEAGIGLEHERHDAGGDRRRKRRARDEDVVAGDIPVAADAVGGGDPDSGRRK